MVFCLCVLLVTSVAYASEAKVRIENKSGASLTPKVVDSFCMKEVQWVPIANNTTTGYFLIKAKNDGFCWFACDCQKFVKISFGNGETARISVPGNTVLVSAATSGLLVRNEGELEDMNRKTIIVSK